MLPNRSMVSRTKGLASISNFASSTRRRKNAVRTITAALRQEAGPDLRVSGISPGYVDTELPFSMTDPAMRAQGMKAMAIPALAIAEAIAFAIAQPANLDVGEIVIRPTPQG